VIRVFPRRTKWTPTDQLAFVGDPPMFRPPEQPVKISCTFTWDKPEAERLYRAWSEFYHHVEVGGPAYDSMGGLFVPGRFVKEGVTITSRGCNRRCEPCFAWRREGYIRELRIEEGYIIQDNNLLACSEPHIKAVFDMLRRQRKAAIFSGGLDTRLFQPWHRELIDSIHVHELWFACDSQEMLKPLERVADMLHGISQGKRRCYVMIGYGNETLLQAESRLKAVYALGFLPFSQLYRGDGERAYTKDWKDLNRKWSRPAAYRKHI